MKVGQVTTLGPDLTRQADPVVRNHGMNVLDTRRGKQWTWNLQRTRWNPWEDDLNDVPLRRYENPVVHPNQGVFGMAS